MLAQLTDYLLRYKTVSIPYVGSFVLHHMPAQLNFAERLIYPPAFTVLYKEEIYIPEHQIHFIGDGAPDSATSKQKLENFGKALKTRIEKEVFTWKGIGLLQWKDNRVVFEQQILDMSLQPVAAHKVIRENTSHLVLVGDQEIQSGNQVVEQIHLSDNSNIKKKKSKAILIGWIALALAIAFVLYYFYVRGFYVLNTGFGAKPTIESPPAMHK